jgi:hypothetical protein
MSTSFSQRFLKNPPPQTHNEISLKNILQMLGEHQFTSLDDLLSEISALSYESCSAEYKQLLRLLSLKLPLNVNALTKLAEFIKVHTDPLPLFEVLAEAIAAMEAMTHSESKKFASGKRDIENLTSVALQVAMDLIESDRTNLVPVLGVLWNVPLDKKQVKFVFLLCVESLELVDPGDFPAVCRTMLRICRDKKSSTEALRAIRNACYNLSVESGTGYADVVLLVSDVLVSAMSSITHESLLKCYAKVIASSSLDFMLLDVLSFLSMLEKRRRTSKTTVQILKGLLMNEKISVSFCSNLADHADLLLRNHSLGLLTFIKTLLFSHGDSAPLSFEVVECIADVLFLSDFSRAEVVRLFIQACCNHSYGSKSLQTSLKCSEYLLRLCEVKTSDMLQFLYYLDEVLHQWRSLPIIIIQRFSCMIAILSKRNTSNCPNLLIYLRKMLMSTESAARLVGVILATSFFNLQVHLECNLSSRDADDIVSWIVQPMETDFSDVSVLVGVCEFFLVNLDILGESNVCKFSRALGQIVDFGPSSSGKFFRECSRNKFSLVIDPDWKWSSIELFYSLFLYKSFFHLEAIGSVSFSNSSFSKLVSEFDDHNPQGKHCLYCFSCGA